MTSAIRIDSLSKRYFVDHDDRQGRISYRTLRDTLTDLAAAPLRRARGKGGACEREEFWALKDISFEVKPGEVLGIIGRNGAGKSTLLKVLSRITKPTSGRVVVNGRVGSLLEVGTGFHPELTGRENIYLNGSILGMRQAEIARRFDEIVAFAEVEQFLDTPVKRYSSGMYVRLAFAVAAHLKPDVLIVDEVLAVGDAGFQRRCYRTLQTLRESGSTVLLVSHNLAAVTTICTRAITLERGALVGSGTAQQQVAAYLARMAQQADKQIEERTDREGDQLARITSFIIRDRWNQPVEHVMSGGEVRIELRCRARVNVTTDYVALSLWTIDGTKLFHIDNIMRSVDVASVGTQRVYTFTLPRLTVPPGMYYWNALVSGDNLIRDHVYVGSKMEVLPGDFYGSGKAIPANGGLMLIDFELCSSQDCRSHAYANTPAQMME